MAPAIATSWRREDLVSCWNRPGGAPSDRSIHRLSLSSFRTQRTKILYASASTKRTWAMTMLQWLLASQHCLALWRRPKRHRSPHSPIIFAAFWRVRGAGRVQDSRGVPPRETGRGESTTSAAVEREEDSR